MREACEILVAAVCPLSCKYCYIPKDPLMKTMHEEIREAMRNGELLNHLQSVFNTDQLKYLGFWGTEPATVFPDILQFLEKAQRVFPRLKNLSFSTSFIFPPKTYLKFLKGIDSLGKDYKVSMQISLDGPSWITDKNRMEGVTERVVNNWKNFINSLNSTPLRNIKLSLKWKATHSIENMEEFLREPHKVEEYVLFFETLNNYFIRHNKNKQVTLALKSYVPTLVVPGKYTSEDGRIFAKYLRLLHSKGLRSSYSYRLKRLIVYERELTKNPSCFTCSGGRSNFGLSDKLTICHRGFYLNDERYVKAVLSHPNLENWDVSCFEKGFLDVYKKNFVVNPRDEANKTRFYYIMRNYHDYLSLKVAATEAILIELAKAGQASRIYLESQELRTFFSLFINSALSCPSENILNTGSLHLQTLSLIRLFANGAFEELIRYELSRGK